LDARLAFRPRKGVELSLVGQNLLQSSHPEYIVETLTPPIEVQRGVYAGLKIEF
jgi:iron complex outermembrane receptor protein